MPRTDWISFRSKPSFTFARSRRTASSITMVSLSVILGLCFSILVLFFSASVIVQKRGEAESNA